MPFKMVTSKMKVDKKLLPIKGHYFFFNAGTAPLVPYLSTYARQLGFSSATVGLIYTVLPIFGLIAKPLFGVIADRFKIQKSLFILFQIVTIVSFSGIYFIPQNQPTVTVELDCNQNVTVVKSCYNSTNAVDSCKVTSLGNQNITSACHMTCDMSSPNMWQTVCDQWHIPQYCYNNAESIGFTTHLNRIIVKEDCGFIEPGNVTLDGYSYKPSCRKETGNIKLNEQCQMLCPSALVTEALGTDNITMTCVDQDLIYKVCSNVTALEMLTTEELNSINCEVLCDLNNESPWKLMEICEVWKAVDAASCHPRMSFDTEPNNLNFTAILMLSTTISEDECVFIDVSHIVLADGTTSHPYCVPRTQQDLELFHTSCEVSCDNEMVNELFVGASDSKKEDESEYTRQFWLFFFMMIVSWIGQAVVVTFADAICFNLLGARISLYGKQRLWGSVGWGIFSLLTGTLIDVFSEGAYKDYTVAFILMFVFMMGDVVISSFLKIESTKMSMSILADVGTLLSSLPTFIFLLWTIAVGLCTGLLWQFLFWLLEDVSKLNCHGTEYIKTLQGLVAAIQTFCGEIPFMFLSGYILRKVGHVNMMSIVLFAFGVRFILYSFLTNPWWVLPIEMLQGITFGMFYPTMTSYANIRAPPGTETTVQGMVGAVFEGVGTSLGSFIGGRLYETHGGWNTFRWFGIGSLIFCSLHVVVQWFLKDKYPNVGATKGYATVIRYEQPTDMIYMLDDINKPNDT